MRKITFMLALFMVSLCQVTAWAAEREMPTAPATTLTSGGKYYLYNVDAGKFLIPSRDRGYEPDTIYIHQTEQENKWAISYGNRAFYYIGKDSIITSSTLGGMPTSDKYTWKILPAENNGYYIQAGGSKGVDEESHWGWLLNFCTCDKKQKWFFLPANAQGDRFVAEIEFYHALKESEASGFDVSYFAHYEKIYTNRSNYTTAEISAYAKEVRSIMPVAKEWWCDASITLFSPTGRYDSKSHSQLSYKTQSYINSWSYSSTYGFYSTADCGTLHARFYAKEKSAFYYTIFSNYSNKIDLYVDGEKMKTMDGLLIDGLNQFEIVDSGWHTLTWKFIEQTGNIYFGNIGLMASPLISVNLKEPGSLGTEVLYHTDHLKNVRNLKIKGTMNDDDWAKMKMMSRLQKLDLSEAVITEIPESQFTDTTMRFLKQVKLPEGLKKINRQAFYDSDVEDLNIPTTLETVCTSAFSNLKGIREFSFPSDTKFDGDNIFKGSRLQKVSLPRNLTELPYAVFGSCKFLEEVVLPDQLLVIDSWAFNNCTKLQNFSFADQSPVQGTLHLPYVVTIGERAFTNCKGIESVNIKSAKIIGSYSFENCNNLTDVSINAYIIRLSDRLFSGCFNLTTLKLYSPTLVEYNSGYLPVSSSILKYVTLQVPYHLVNSYKLDDYWYNAKIEGFDYSDMTYIPIRQNLTLNSERFGGKPAIEIFGNAYLKINGNDAQAFQNMKFKVDPGASLYGQLLNNSNTVTQEGELKLDYYTKAKKWYFITLPFDLDIAKITHDVAGTQYAIRSYDGATRAVNGATGNWKNIDRTTTIPAGTGFIFQTNVNTWSTFFAAEGSENLAISTNEFEKALEVNASTENSHKGWNLVGNPYQCFYNNHMLNFTAPITVWDVDKKTYAAYSITDDDYALRPNEAFFIQCPNAENNTISFPLQGRQLTNVVNSQNAVKANGAAVRKLVDLALTQNGMEDKTRVVFNDNASMAYETGCDAGKFMSMEADVPQVYTLDAQANTYAINERPFGDGIVQLGIYVAKEGTYTFSAQRNSVGNIYLVDNKEGVIINLREQDYTFQSEAGTIEGRFSLCLNANGMATGIQDMQEDTTEGADLYDLSGKRISQTQKGVYVIRKAGKSEKVMVK